MSLEVADCFQLLLFVVWCCWSTTSISITSELDLQYLNYNEAYRVFAVSDSGLCCNGALSLFDRAPLLFKVVGISKIVSSVLSMWLLLIRV